MKSNVQTVERCTLRPWSTLHTFSLDISTERTTSHTQTNWFTGDKRSQRSPCRLSSQGAQQLSGLHPPLRSSRLRCPKATASAAVPALLLWPHMNSNCWENATIRPSHKVWQQQAGGAEPCPALSPLSLFLLTQLGPGASWFPGNSWPLQKSWCKQRELCKSLDPPRGNAELPYH